MQTINQPLVEDLRKQTPEMLNQSLARLREQEGAGAGPSPDLLAGQRPDPASVASVMSHWGTSGPAPLASPANPDNGLGPRQEDNDEAWDLGAPWREIEADASPNQGGARHTALRGVSGAGQELPHKEKIQRSFGGRHDVSGIRAHVGGTAKEASERIGATGYAIGDQVAFQSAPDLHLAAHEAAHVIQQGQGVQAYGGLGRGGQSEKEADAVADRVVAGKSAADLLDQTSGQGAGVVQRQATAMGPQCDDLLERIRRYIFSRKPPGTLKGLQQRMEELMADPQNLQFDHWTVPHPQFGSVESHQRQFRGIQQGLRNALEEWQDNDCDDRGGGRLPQNAWEWATRPAPRPIPRPNPNQQRSQPVPDEDFMKKMEVLTGLTGTALIIYLIISEGSRLFPPRNLIPVP